MKEQISIEEVYEMKAVKAPRLDGFPAECLKKEEGITVFECLETVELMFLYGVIWW